MVSAVRRTSVRRTSSARFVLITPTRRSEQDQPRPSRRPFPSAPLPLPFCSPSGRAWHPDETFDAGHSAAHTTQGDLLLTPSFFLRSSCLSLRVLLVIYFQPSPCRRDISFFFLPIAIFPSSSGLRSVRMLLAARLWRYSWLCDTSHLDNTEHPCRPQVPQGP